MKFQTTILTIMALIVFMPNAWSDLASQSYVDAQTNLLRYGTATPTAEQLDDGTYNGGIHDMVSYMLSDGGYITEADLPEMDELMAPTDQPEDAIVITDDYGNIKMATGAPITNAKISSNAAIELGKLAFPTPPASCSTSGCMLMFYDNKYVWEPIGRGTNETISTTGYVSATPTATTTSNEAPININGDEIQGYDGHK